MYSRHTLLMSKIKFRLPNMSLLLFSAFRRKRLKTTITTATTKMNEEISYIRCNQTHPPRDVTPMSSTKRNSQ